MISHHLHPVSGADFLDEASENVRMFDDGEVYAAPDQQIGVSVGSRVFSSGLNVLTSYIVPKQTWRYLSTPERKENWVTPQIPDNVSTEAFDSFSRTRIAYVSEYNWQRTGARGMYAITHYGYSNFGLTWVIGSPIAPDLYRQLGAAGGLSGARFAILARNTYWAAAALGGLKMGAGGEPQLIVHYNDGPTYHLLHLPWTTVTDFIWSKSSPAVKEVEWPDRHDDSTTLLGSDVPLAPPSALAPGATPKTAAKLISAEFENIDLTRFWPQLWTALDIALYSPTRSKNLFAELSELEHWSAVKSFLEKNSGRFEWAPPRVDGYIGKVTKPDYMSP